MTDNGEAPIIGGRLSRSARRSNWEYGNYEPESAERAAAAQAADPPTPASREGTGLAQCGSASPPAVRLGRTIVSAFSDID
jgi:hypothetical protein